MIFTTLAESVGKVIREQPYVELITEPKQEEFEIPCELKGLYLTRWTALANVDGMLCLIELKITEQQNGQK